ncbi:protein-glutamate methylesterase/protein-glutamine glutaminase [Methylocystis echinoides]|jgi:two-component system chemotaxis response regulator CheB|uniref:Protein-glutamate methylesterase/protein-glutamine glutaminase n=1 Tax=Methylocystis echinoides TaxID=29468 RepID=A0A9W6LRI7_9HYPH|nr:chemotaxis response regulator protein-glutamate methylesterase [Methylocystis echinoides]GLI92451.1 chemotaxis response regulator protein-glutamate methylesterase [Methylocystis echinoides]
MKPCSVLVVDDSRTMRSLIAATLAADPEITVVGEASDAFEAREAIKQLSPDVVTLDIEMPKMNGLDFLERIMRLRPTPVIIISSLTERGTETSIRALEIGAVDCIAKPSARNRDSLDDLGSRVKAAASARLPRGAATARRSIEQGAVGGSYLSDGRVVAIGASMGGVEALCSLLGRFPENCPPTLVTQHMPAMFTKSFADRLDRLCRPKVTEAVDGAALIPGNVYIAPGGWKHMLVAGSDRTRVRLQEGELVSGHRPSVDALFQSVARTLGSRAIGVILTGMGRDGAQGLLSMRQSGAETIGQDEATSLVYGMPRAAFENGSVGAQLPLGGIAERIMTMTNKTRIR